MCFSASASFTASAFLMCISLVGFVKLKAHNHFLLALVPFLFALQQACEGIVWLTFTHPQLLYLRKSAAYSFLFFAFIVWPIFIPYAVRMYDPLIKHFWYKLSLFSGIACASGLLFLMVNYGVVAEAIGHHIVYTMYISGWLQVVGTIAYLIATVVPFFATYNLGLWFFGCLILIAYITSYVFFTHALGSVWCFFAALLSCLIVHLI